MSTESVRQRLAQAVLLALGPVLLPCVAVASPQETVIERAEPSVPAPRSVPCEVRLFDHATFPATLLEDPTVYSFDPPAGCRPPWAKVVLSMDLEGTRDAQVRGIAMALEGVTLFMGPTPNTLEPSHWHVERDLTDYSALFKAPGTGELAGLPAFRDSTEGPYVTGSATVRFYPATATQPAPRVPDAVFPAYTALLPPMSERDRAAAIKALPALPHNIERAYLDVTANDFAFWYTCITPELADAHPTLVSRVALGLTQRAIFPVEQGCLPHSYADVGVTVDGTPAGVAPVFPWLPTDFSMNYGPIQSPFWNAVDVPTDSIQSLAFVPWRVDLTPFAAILDEAGSHQVALHMVDRTEYYGLWFLAPRTANLLVYLDHGKRRLTGAVTYNSLPPKRPQPLITDGLTQEGDLLHGQVRTRLDRAFEIRGYVDTSHGRIHSKVSQQSTFDNLQKFYVDDSPTDAYDIPYYREDVQLATRTKSVSSRTRNGRLLSKDRQEVSYPLDLRYIGIGRLTDYYSESGDPDIDLFGGSIEVTQQRIRDVHHYHHNRSPYDTHLGETFYGRHRVDADTQADSHWHAAHAFAFHDNAGSCYQKVVTTKHGMLLDTGTGSGCPDGQNHKRWFAHPDGSADGLGWLNP